MGKLIGDALPKSPINRAAINGPALAEFWHIVNSFLPLLSYGMFTGFARLGGLKTSY